MIKLNPSRLLFTNICISIGIGIILPLASKVETEIAILFSLLGLIISLLLEIWMKIEEIKKTQRNFLEGVTNWTGQVEKNSNNLFDKFHGMDEEFHKSILEVVPSKNPQIFKTTGLQFLNTYNNIEAQQDKLIFDVFEMVCVDFCKTLTQISQGKYLITKERYVLGKLLRKFLEKLIANEQVYSLKGVSYGKIENHFHFWETLPGESFLNLNVEASKNNCKVSRVFVIDESELSSKSYLIDKQKEKGIEVYTCLCSQLPSAVQDNLAPCFIINDKWVFVPDIVFENNELIASGEEGSIITSKEEVKFYLENFDKLVRFSQKK
jgi:hypothetical protein